MLILNADDVRTALPMRAVIEATKRAYVAIHKGKAEVPLRARLPVEKHDGVSLIMPAYVETRWDEAMAVKIVSVFPRNRDKGMAIIQAGVIAFDAKTGVPIAVMEGGVLTAIRTGAASGAATDLLARPESKSAAIFGAGVQGRTQLEAICTVRPIEQAWIYDLDRSSVDKFIADMAGKRPMPHDLRAAKSPEEAVANADIICTATTATTPVFPDEAVKPGTHINGVGAYTLEMVEVPPETIRRSSVYVDSVQAALEEAGDLVAALNRNLVHEDEFIELGAAVEDASLRRTSDEEITFFKSVGVAVQDAIAAQLALHNAEREGLGQEVAW
jgi:ornithine cyclodeaminase